MELAQLDQFILNVNNTNRLRDIYGSKLLGELKTKRRSPRGGLRFVAFLHFDAPIISKAIEKVRLL